MQPNTEEIHDRGGDYKKYSVNADKWSFPVAQYRFLTNIASNKKVDEGRVYWQQHIVVFIGQLETL